MKNLKILQFHVKYVPLEDQEKSYGLKMGLKLHWRKTTININQICLKCPRKVIRESICKYNPHLNLYTATETLSLPEILKNALLFNKPKKDFKKLIKEMNMR